MSRKNKTGVGLIPATWKKKSKRTSTKLLARAFGLAGKRCERQTRQLSQAWNPRRKAARGSLLGILPKPNRRKKGKPAPGSIVAVFHPITEGKKRITLGSVPRGILGAIGAIGRLRRDEPRIARGLSAIGQAADPQPTAAELLQQVSDEAVQQVHSGNALREARESKDVLSRVAEWIRSRFRQPA